MLRMRTLPAGFIEPCLPTMADTLPSSGPWLHESKHDGFRIIARKTGVQVKLCTRPGNDLTERFSLIVETLANLRTRSCIIDGEAVACDDNGLAMFEPDSLSALRWQDLSVRLRLDRAGWRRSAARAPRCTQVTLRSLLVKVGPRLRWNEHIEGDGETIFRHACKLGLEGIVSKRLGSPYSSGRSRDWLKFKNPLHAAVKREAEEEWS